MATTMSLSKREETRAYQRRYHIDNRERIRARKRRYWIDNKGREQARWRRVHKQRLVERRGQVDALKDRACMDCNMAYPSYVMQFDHRDPAEKLFGIGSALGKGRPMELILAEISKCDVVCSNCHTVRTFGGGDKAQTRYQRTQVDALKERACMDCGQRYPSYCMQFDHRDPATKLFGISAAVARHMSMEPILAEIDKCDVICGNCHAERSFGGKE